ncbi:FmdB family zinc ribbon protein [Nocardia bovistercoris]|uniref:FmdB family transcriptional regulator n=1 Tax=Nocardia bovistercoris TaxID=2785916 RepID=A0A931N1N9_9NOCA|nr:FmdB family transcriptional regulator [Nocardia bovistercoris]
MPTYSYACTQCDNRFDIVQSFSDEALTVCDQCSGKLRKLFNSVGIVFKGSGFYRTDSRSGGSGSTASEPAKSESSSASTTTSSDSSSSSSTGNSSTSSSSTSTAVAS